MDEEVALDDQHGGKLMTTIYEIGQYVTDKHFVGFTYGNSRFVFWSPTPLTTGILCLRL